MKIDNIALLIPTHPPHYHYIYSLINKCISNSIEVDIFLIFSNTSDYTSFNMKNQIKPIIYDSYKPEYRKSIVTYKKFFGLTQLADSKYDYIICCDSEIDIVCNNFTNEIINKKINNIFNNKKIYAGYTDDNSGKCIIRISAGLFPDKSELLENITHDFTLYFWWSDLPVYRRADITPFLNMINYENIGPNHFDYIIYQYYLILCHGFEIINTTPITKLNWSLEYLCTDNIDILNQLIDIGYGFSWNTKNMYELNASFIDSQNGFIIYHLDR